MIFSFKLFCGLIMKRV